jgi:hypothetical protein
MYTVIRRWADASALIDEMTRRPDEVERVITTVPGFVAYHAIREGNTLVTVSICQDRAGAEETTRQATQWVRDNLAAGSVGAPEVAAGEPFLSFGTTAGSKEGAGRS